MIGMVSDTNICLASNTFTDNVSPGPLSPKDLIWLLP